MSYKSVLKDYTRKWTSCGNTSGMMTVLVIEDNNDLREVLRYGLELAGYQVTEAKNGLDGLSRFYEYHPDLVVTDIVMEQLEGMELLLTIRKTHPQIPVIAISGHARYLDASRKLGATETLQKPFGVSELLICIEHVLANESTS